MSSDPAELALARVRSAAKTSREVRSRPRPAPTLSGSGPDARDPQLLGPALSGWVRSHGYGSELAVAGVAERWPLIVGPQIADHATVGGYTPLEKGGELLIEADSAEWAVQLRYLVGDIQRRIDEEIGSGVVTRLTVRGPGRRATPGGWRVRTGRRSPRQPAPEPPPEQGSLTLE